ncbi:DNA damage-inducible protein D [Acetobacter tropicalis]|uniref:DNA damage-inducible protein D n=1 Tax=Acetobacter tropicalis TaxID=104102 RepID=UPI001931001F|nr:DNA damage-inducible protein D [Acetobacter tropicalis]MDO8171656.1 DNA damage-inducible protein D [Acetobacter tropicalis]
MSDEVEKSRRLASIAFEGEVVGLKRKKQDGDTIEDLMGEFEAISQVDDMGNEYWFARDLQVVLGYTKWDNFVTVISRAKDACTQAGHGWEDHFPGVGKMIPLGKGAEREIEDIVLSRYACYLIAQNADPRKKQVAFAQTYFAIQTRRQEVQDQEAQEYQPLSEDERRVLLRNEIKTHNKHLASAAKNAGVKEGLDYAIFQTEGYKGLYGGLDVPGIRRKKGLTSRQPILDHMGSTELAANLFRATQTEEKLRREGVRGKRAANQAHYDVGAKVRQTIKDIGGDMPETLPAEEDVKKIGRRLQKAIKQSTKDGE